MGHAEIELLDLDLFLPFQLLEQNIHLDLAIVYANLPIDARPHLGIQAVIKLQGNAIRIPEVDGFAGAIIMAVIDWVSKIQNMFHCQRQGVPARI